MSTDQPLMMNLVTYSYDRDGRLLSKAVEQVPNDGSYERGCRLLFEMAQEDDPLQPGSPGEMGREGRAN
jgi:hypothetical protein